MRGLRPTSPPTDSSVSNSLIAHSLDGQADREGRAVPFAGTLRLHGPAVHFGQMLDDGKPQAQSAVRPSRRAVGLAEALKDVRQQFRTDTLPIVTHNNS